MDQNDIDVINAKLDSIQAMLMELLEFKNEMEEAVKNFQPPNIMKLMSGGLGSLFGARDGESPSLPQIPQR